MLINGIDVSSLGVKLYDRVLSSNQIDTVDSWLDGDIQPTNIRQQEKFRNIQLSFLVLGNNEQDAFYRISRLTKELKKASIQFDDIDLIFDVSILGAAKTDRLKNGNFIVSYNLHSDYAKGSREIYTTNANLTNAFKLNLLYYQNSTQLIASESITIRASGFNGVNDSLASLGIDLDKYLPDYYNPGVATNLNGLDISYDNLQYLGTIIINYTPIRYNLTVSYMIDDGNGFYTEMVDDNISITYPQLQQIQTIGQLVNPQQFKPEGYKSKIYFEGELTIENLLSQNPIRVLYEKIKVQHSKYIVLNYFRENDEEQWTRVDDPQTIVVYEEDCYDGLTLGTLFNTNQFRPNPVYYAEGYIQDYSTTDLVKYEELETSYDIKYPRQENTIFIEYYAGLYPGWSRITTSTLTTKYKDSYENNFSLDLLGIDINKYHTSTYQNGVIYNNDVLTSYDAVLNAGVLQIFYAPIYFTIKVNYEKSNGEPIATREYQISELEFFGIPLLSDIIDINTYRPEGYQLSVEESYSGDITLAAMTQASPIRIVFEEIEVERTKNVLIHYKQEQASVFSTINTSLITINESDCVNGVRLKDLINLNIYQPTYYQAGQIDGYSAVVPLSFDDIRSEYNVIYLAETYTTPVRYYTDDVDDANWIGSSSISYRIIDFETTTTLYDLGLNVNNFKPTYCDDGVVQYHGAINFQSLRNIESIDIVYDTIVEPSIEDGINYPHRFLFLQHNDLGEYEGLHPEWILNHAYINTGVTAQDMSKLTVIMECKRVDENVPLHEVNGAYGYLFGSSSGQGAYFMRFNNQTKYHSGSLTGINTYEAKAGYYSTLLSLTEQNAVGWSENSGIYASARDGYSNATFTYTNPIQTDSARMPQPLYLFANNSAGQYEHGLAGIGIFGCRIYYDNLLIRDMIPVQTYDKIGDLVAPSNCLYDKVTKTFFEDATGQNSFNIIDDDRYQDDDPDHIIGYYYVNYYQSESRFKSSLIYFRASDFIDKFYDYEAIWDIEGNQPAFYKPGYIVDKDKIDFSFNGLNKKVISIVYEEDENNIVVNYYKNDGVNPPELLATDTITLKEKDFYQVPTFGDIVRLNKYKPNGYKTDYTFPETKVTMKRVLTHSPYTIDYVPEEEPLIDYTTQVKYIRKVYGIRAYETIDTITLHFDQTNFRDGEYIDFYIDKNYRKPEKYYLDGECYLWYEMDERLTTPEDLKESYTICYNPAIQSLDVNYYTDDWDEANLIASTSWEFKLDDFDPAYPFYLVDQLPNEYINKYRPSGCDGGVLQNSNVELTFTDLAELEEIAIVYDTIVEPHDPTEDYYERKILYWGDLCNRIYPSYKEITAGLSTGAILQPYQVPYIDLGYKPKEIGRLRVEWTGASKPIGVVAPTHGDSYWDSDYTTIFGYRGPTPFTVNEKVVQFSQVLPTYTRIMDESVYDMLGSNPTLDTYWAGSSNNFGSKGYFSIKPRIPNADGPWVYTHNGPTQIDGQNYASTKTVVTNQFGLVYYTHPGIQAGFRRGNPFNTDDNYNVISSYNRYDFSKDFTFSGVPDKQTDGYMQINGAALQAVGLNSYDDSINLGNQEGTWVGNYGFANPFTVVLDAYNDYCSIWNYHDSNTPFTWQIENTDKDIWEDIERPRGSLSLFTSTNPTTGLPNVLDDVYWSFPSLGIVSGSFGYAFGVQGIHTHPYTADDLDDIYEVTLDIWEVITKDGNGDLSGEAPSSGQNTDPGGGGVALGKQTLRKTQKSVNALFGDWVFPTFPWQAGGALWSLKIYDQDRLVRDLVPVAKGDQVYDYIMPNDGLFDLVTEIFFTNTNPGKLTKHNGTQIEYTPARLYVVPDILSYGKITTNYYDYDNTFLGNKFVDVPTWFCGRNTTIEDILQWNDMKPDDYHLDGWLDVDQDWSWYGDKMNLAQIYEMGAVNIYYRLRTFTKTVVYYRGNVRVGSRDLMYSLDDIRNARTLADLGLVKDLYYDEHFAHGRVIFNESIIAGDNIEDFINAPSPVVVYDKLSKEEAPNLLYVEYYRGGAYDSDEDDIRYTWHLDPENENYIIRQSGRARVLNPYGAVLYSNHYHQALYEDENFGEFIPYQVRVLNKYAGLHNGPARKYKTLAMIIERDTYTIIQERNGWGRLKEYPNAWILLSQTEPITGPGQNPVYEGNESYNSIPFGDYVSFTKMTTDRQWINIIDDYWIKAEDVSLSQYGSFLEGISIEVIDLSEIDFNSNIQSLIDIGIDIQKYRMRFHDISTYTYSQEYTYNNLSNLHSIEIMYPETIYRYSCLYYKDNINEDNRLGGAMFSCSIGNWNPDWDKFIETSWQTEKIYGSAYVRKQSGSGYVLVRNLYATPDISGEVNGQVQSDDPLLIDEPVQTSGTITYYHVIGQDYQTKETISGYIDGANLIVEAEYGGEVQKDPVLYRDTPLTLTWDYFGFDKNKFKPEGYSDGIYLWNPRSWDKDNIKFTFEELIKCGTQYVFYPSFDPNTYKIWIKGNYIGIYTSNAYYYNSPGLELDLSNPDIETGKYLYALGAEHYDIYASGEWRNDLGYSSNFSTTNKFYVNPEKNAKYNTRLGLFYLGVPYSGNRFWNAQMPYDISWASYGEEPIADRIVNIKDKDMVIMNVSNYRYAPTGILGVGNIYTHQEPQYFLPGSATPIADSTNFKDYHKDVPMNINPDGSYAASDSAIMNGSKLTRRWFRGIVYDVISYYDFFMKHYYVPVPRGMRYKYSGVEKIMPDNGMFDLLTGTFCQGFRASKYNPKSYADPNASIIPYGGWSGTLQDGEELIFLRNAEVSDSNAFIYVHSETYQSFQVNNQLYTVQPSNEEIKSYLEPDDQTFSVRTLTPGLLMPVSRYTEDSNNGITGKWYFSGDQWVQNSKIALTPTPSDYTIRVLATSVGLIPGTYNRFYVYNSPDKEPGTRSDYFYGQQPVVIKVYYTATTPQGEFLFDGGHWIPKAYTDADVTDSNKTYVITSTTNYYSHPIKDNIYRLGSYLYGERVTVLYTATNAPDWGFIGSGWIYMPGNTSEVIIL